MRVTIDETAHGHKMTVSPGKVGGKTVVRLTIDCDDSCDHDDITLTPDEARVLGGLLADASSRLLRDDGVQW